MHSKVIIIALVGLNFFTASSQSTKDASYFFEKAEAALAENQYKIAIDNYTRGLQLQPAYYEGYLFRGTARNNINDTGGALSDYSIYLEHDPENAEALFQRGFLHYLSEHFELAKLDFQHLLKISDTGETNSIVFRMPAYGRGVDKIFTTQNNQRDYIFNYLGLSQYNLKEYSAAIAAFDSALSLNKSEPSYYIHRGLVNQALGEYKSAARDYHNALKLDPENGLALNNLAVISKENSGDSTEYYLDAAVERSPDLPYPYAERGYYWLQQKEFRKALADYSDAIRTQPNDPEYWLNRGIAFYNLESLQQAKNDFDNAINIKPEYTLAYLNRGNVFMKLKNYNQAIDDYSSAIVYDKTYGLAYYNRALALKAMGKFSKSCADLLTAEQNGIHVNPRLRNSVCKQP